MKLVKRSRYLLVNTAANITCDRPEIPATERVFHIFIARINIAIRCAKSAVSRKIFILPKRPALSEFGTLKSSNGSKAEVEQKAYTCKTSIKKLTTEHKAVRARPSEQRTITAQQYHC
ncbi:unnamed protein product [Anisakis simplex]|uniref:Uncharacterized protein n=1 Tax=Anisakis simplex TaxID=6269 RepID=A0A0M3KBF3_ANISI|nr:unnamed protein product [Anisakis simplex]